MGQRGQYSDHDTNWTMRFRISAGQAIFLSSKTSNFALWPRQHVIKISAHFIHGDESEAGLSPLFNASVNMWSHNSTLSYAFMTWPGSTSHFIVIHLSPLIYL